MSVRPAVAVVVILQDAMRRPLEIVEPVGLIARNSAAIATPVSVSTSGTS